MPPQSLLQMLYKCSFWLCAPPMPPPTLMPSLCLPCRKTCPCPGKAAGKRCPRHGMGTHTCSVWAGGPVCSFGGLGHSGDLEVGGSFIYMKPDMPQHTCAHVHIATSVHIQKAVHAHTCIYRQVCILPVQVCRQPWSYMANYMRCHMYAACMGTQWYAAINTCSVINCL